MTNNKNISSIFKVLQDPIRVRIVEMLSYEQDRREFLPDTEEGKEGFCPMDILSVLHAEGMEVSNTKLSYHLKELKESDLIFLVKEGKRNFYLFNKDEMTSVFMWMKNILDA